MLLPPSLTTFFSVIEIYVEQKIKSLLLRSITVDAKPSIDRSLPHTSFTSFAALHLMQKNGWAGPPFYRKRQKKGSWMRPFGLNAWNIFYLDLENKTPIEDLWLLIFNSDGIHLSQITKVSTQKPLWPFSQPQGWLFTFEEVDLNLRYTHRVYTVTYILKQVLIVICEDS